MHEYYLIFQSLTVAQRASKLLKHRGMKALVVSTPADLSSDGCGYSIKLERMEYEKAKRYLDQMMIPYRAAIYR